jgi:hypothetical protein
MQGFNGESFPGAIKGHQGASRGFKGASPVSKYQGASRESKYTSRFRNKFAAQEKLK